MVVPRLILLHLKLLHQAVRQHLRGLFRGQRPPPPPPSRLSRCPGLFPGPAAFSQSRPRAGRAAAQALSRRLLTVTRRAGGGGPQRTPSTGSPARLALPNGPNGWRPSVSAGAGFPSRLLTPQPGPNVALWQNPPRLGMQFKPPAAP